MATAFGSLAAYSQVRRCITRVLQEFSWQTASEAQGRMTQCCYTWLQGRGPGSIIYVI